ncbi:MAG: CNNM domain-containing protein [Campylobacterales bacterium]
MTLLIIFFLVAIGVSFVCSILEAVLLSTTHHFVQMHREKNPKSGALLLKLKTDIDIPISAILTLNTIAHTIGAAGVGAQAAKVFGDDMQVAISIILTLAILYLSEIIPKTIGALYWKKLAAPSAYVINVLIKVTYPLVWTSLFITKALSRNKQKETVTREEILALTELGEKSGSLREKESELIENLLMLKDIKARDILTPRSVVFAMDENVTIEDAVEIDEAYVYSRIPIYEESIDNVTGFVFNQKIFEESIENEHGKKLYEISVPIFRISENLPVLNLFDLFIKRKEHMFLVTDGYGQTAGIVTLEDAIETLLGVEIMDELDEFEDMQAVAKEKAKRMRLKVTKKDEKKRLDDLAQGTHE